MTKNQTFIAKCYCGFAIMGGGYMAILSLISIPVSISHNTLWSWSLFCTTTAIALFFSAHIIAKKTKKSNTSVFYSFICDIFQPNKDYELKGYLSGKYVGIDTEHGTMLLASSFNKIFKGLNVKELAGYECRGNMLTLKFNNTDFPMFKISFGSESECMNFGHKLDVLLSSSYQPAINTGRLFNDFVQQKALAF